MAISIDFLSNVSGFLRGTSDAAGALDDVAGSLDDLVADARSAGDSAGSELGSGITSGGAEAERAVDGVEGKLRGLDGDTGAGDDLGSDVKAGAAEGEQAVDSLEAKFRDLAAASRTQTSAVGSDISTSVKHGTEEANEGVETLKENTGSNLKEVAASFDGTWAGVAGGAQGLVAEIAEGFGPAGLIAGAVAAGGIGLIISGIEGAQESTDEFKQHVSDLTGELIDTGREGGRSLEGIQSKIKDLASSQDDVNLVQLWQQAKDGGLDYKDVVAAMVSGNSKQLEAERDRVGEIADKHFEIASQSNIAGYTVRTNSGIQAEAAEKVETALEGQRKEAKAAELAQEAAARAGLSDYRLKQKAIEQLQGAYADAAGEVDDYVDKETGLFDVTKYIRAMDQRADALRDYQETLAKSSLSPEARDYIESQGEEQAATLIAGYKRATPDQRDELNRIWTTSGRQSASSYTEALGDDLRDTTLRGPRVTAPSTADYEEAVRDANRRAQQYLNDHPLRAGAVGYTVGGKPLY